MLKSRMLSISQPKQLEKLDVPQTAKEKILSETRKSINSGEIQNKTNPNLMTAAERQQIIDMNVQKALALFPKDKEPQQRNRFTKRLKNRWMRTLPKKGKLVKIYENQVRDYAQKTIASSFADLYKASIPFVLLSCLTGFIFLERKRKSAAPFANTPATDE